MIKGHTTDKLLAVVIAALEQDDPQAHWHMCRSLVAGGPLIASAAFDDMLNRPPESDDPALSLEEADLISAELLQFLRRLVQQHDRGMWSAEIGISGPFTYLAVAAGPKVALGIEGALRIVIVQQFVHLLQEVGIANVRRCTAPDCARIYVKTYRREYCSRACARRSYMRVRREGERQARERRARRYRQQRTRQGQGR